MSSRSAADFLAASKVLVVEDEAGLRFVTSDFLKHDCGYTVIEAVSADEAVELLKSIPDIRCVVTDVRMPGRLDGIALTRHVREAYPNLPIIMTSGNLLPEERIADVPFMAKPYDVEILSRAIQALIGRLA